MQRISKPPTNETLEKQIGEAIRQFRTANRVGLAALAERAGISKGFLSKIERGEKAPAISTLMAIAAALNIRLSSLLEPDRQDHRVSVVRKNERPDAIRYASAFGYKYSALTHNIPGKHMEAFVIVFPRNPRQQHGGGLRHAGEEFVMTLKGKIQFAVGNQTFILEPGDALYFDANLPHWGKSLADGDSEALDVTFTLNAH
jgi:transcriptional regulator with XRE-family HTH domain